MIKQVKQKFAVKTTNVYPNHYEILFTDNIQPVNDLLQSRIKNKILVISDNNVLKYHLEKLINELTTNSKQHETLTHIIQSGEEYKTQSTVQNVLKVLFENRFSKNDTIISLGGGIVNDVTGYTASIYKRGMNWVTLPTSLLAMVDASIGGKTGINNEFGKNMIGSMYNPSLVLINTSYLKTLPQDRFSEGLVELSKHFILFEKENFEKLSEIIKKCESKNNLLSNDDFRDMILAAIMVKRDVVEKDARESGIRRVLNIGHTIGHAIEKASANTTHGFAVAKGIIAELSYGVEKNIVSKRDLVQIQSFYSTLGIDWSIDNDVNTNELMEYITNDKKINHSGTIPLTLIENIGKIYKDNGKFTHEVKEKSLKQFLERYTSKVL